MSSSNFSKALKIFKNPAAKLIYWTVPFGTLTVIYSYCLPSKKDVAEFLTFALPCLAAIVAGAGIVIKQPTSQPPTNNGSIMTTGRKSRLFESLLYIVSYALLLGAFYSYYLKSPLQTQVAFTLKLSIGAFLTAVAIEAAVLFAIWLIQLRKPFSSVSGIESITSGILIFSIPAAISVSLLVTINLLAKWLPLTAG